MGEWYSQNLMKSLRHMPIHLDWLKISFLIPNLDEQIKRLKKIYK